MESPSPSFLLWGLQRDQPDARTKDGDPKAQKPQTCCSVPSALAGPAGADTMGPSLGVMPGWEGAKDPGSPAEGSPAPPRGPTTTQDTWPGTAEDSKQPPRPASGTSCSEMQPLRPAFLWLLLRSVRLSVLPAGGQPCVRGVRLPAGCPPRTSTAWREQSAFPGSRPRARKEVGPRPSTGYRPHGTSPTPTGLRAPRLGWDWGGRGPQPRAVRTTGLRGSREQVGHEERGGARAVPGLLPAPGWGTLD